jgi:hypothetical protein
MRKYLLITSLLTLLILILFLSYYFLSSKPALNQISIDPPDIEKLNYNQFLEIGENFKIKEIKPEKLNQNSNIFLKKILTPKNWEVTENDLNFLATSNEIDFIYIRKFFISKNEAGEAFLDINKSSNYSLESSLGRAPTAEEKINLEKESVSVNKMKMEEESLFNFKFIENLSSSFVDKNDMPILELNANKLIRNFENREISGVFNYNGKIEGNDRVLHEFLNGSNEFIWVFKENDTIMYSFGYAATPETKDLLRILFLNIE